MREYKPNTLPKNNIKNIHSSPKIFLGGTIDMGNSEDWQANLTKNLSEEDVVIFNPRRDDWDSSWDQSPWPGTHFYEQVDWELKAQEASDILVYVLLPESKSPITLLEIGLFARSQNQKVFVVCPKEYYRYGNVRIVSELYDLKFFHSIEEMLQVLKIHISEWKYLTAPIDSLYELEREYMSVKEEIDDESTDTTKEE